LRSSGLPLGPAPAAAADPCNRFFETAHDRAFCRTKRRRCRRAGTDFCIITNPANPPKRATCCHRGGVCCNGDCCGPWRYGDESIPGKCCHGECCPGLYDCCPANPPGKDRCCAAHEGETCCPDNPSGCCPRGLTCCPGVGCVDGECPCTGDGDGASSRAAAADDNGCGEPDPDPAPDPNPDPDPDPTPKCLPGMKPCRMRDGTDRCIQEAEVCCYGYYCNPGHACCGWSCGPNNECAA
jgi:hypothetical protein